MKKDYRFLFFLFPLMTILGTETDHQRELVPTGNRSAQEFFEWHTLEYEGYGTVVSDGVKKAILGSNGKRLTRIGYIIPFETERADYLLIDVRISGNFGDFDHWEGIKLVRRPGKDVNWNDSESFAMNHTRFYPPPIIDYLTEEEVLGITTKHRSEEAVALLENIWEAESKDEWLRILASSRHSQPNDADNPVNSPENPKNHTDD